MNEHDEKLAELELRITGLEQRVENLETEELPYIKARLVRLEDEERGKILEEFRGLREDFGRLRQSLDKAIAEDVGLAAGIRRGMKQ